jgi:hypothetical protein
VLVSEDARLVAMRLADENVALNRTRPSSFTMHNWQRGLQAADIVKQKTSCFRNPKRMVRSIQVSPVSPAFALHVTAAALSWLTQTAHKAQSRHADRRRRRHGSGPLRGQACRRHHWRVKGALRSFCARFCAG